MIVTKNKTLILLASCIAISAIASTGCRSGGFKKPNLAVLKFWENPDAVASKTPPPPARYFDPAPIRDEQVAQNKADETIDLDGQRLKDTLDQSIAKNTSQITNNVNTDIRSLNEVLKNKKNQLSTSIDNTQKNLQTAMKDSVKNAGSTTKAVDSVKNQLNDFKPAADLKTPTSKTKLNQSLAGLNKSIYDANGKLVNSSAEVKESILSKLDPTRNATPGAKMNEFIAAANSKVAKAFSPKSNDFDFKAPSLPKSTPLTNAFAATAPKSQPTKIIPASKPSASDAELKKVQAQVAEANRQIAQLKQQIASSSNQPKSLPVATVAPSPTPKTPVASNSFNAAPQRAPVERVAQLQTPRFGNSSYSAISKPKPDSSFVSASPTNILRSSQQLQPSKPIQSAPANAQPAFPSTPHGNFAPHGKFGSTALPTASPREPKQIGLAPQPAAPVNFQADTDNSMTLKASTPYSMSEPTTGVQQIKSHIDIPASILNGSGSYAPGSVRQVGQ